MGCSVGIIGGGAAGMMAAVTAARQGAEVTLLERNDRVGKKILSTGNGKCNLGNERLDVDFYYTESPDFLESCLKKFGVRETISFFQDIGLMVKSRNGYLYPVCEQASAVLDVLRFELRRAGVHVITDCKIESIRIPADGRKPSNGRRNQGDAFTAGIRLEGDGKSFFFDRVIIACGGQAASKTGSDGSGYKLACNLGHRLVPVVPALVQLRCREDFFKSVAGVRADAELSVVSRGRCVARERGELQLTDYGISGIPVFQFSRVVNYILRGEKEAEVRIDFFPDYSEAEFRNFAAGRKALQEGRTVEEYFTGLLNKKLMLLFIKLAGLKAAQCAEGADPERMGRVYRLCRQWTVHVTGSNPFENAQVCAGGVHLDEVTDKLESRKAPGVYFAGEVLDVDGKCGGYNLQWAWCSGYLAGMAASAQNYTGIKRSFAAKERNK